MQLRNVTEDGEKKREREWEGEKERESGKEGEGEGEGERENGERGIFNFCVNVSMLTFMHFVFF